MTSPLTRPGQSLGQSPVAMVQAAGTGVSPLTTKGDLYTYTTVDARLAVGTNNYVLQANSATATGLEWTNSLTGVGLSDGSINTSDTMFEIYDNADPTKSFLFQVSGVTTGTARTLTIPDANGTIALTTVAGGGTGAATFTDGGVIVGNGIGALQATAVGTAGQPLVSNGAGSDPTFQALNLADTDAITGDLPFANLTQGSALSVLGVTGNATADNASIAAGSDYQVLRRSGTAVAFGSVNLASSNAVTGLLPLANMETSGTVIARIIRAMPPASTFAQEYTIAGVSTPAESIAVFAFDDTTTEYMDYLCELLPTYQGGGLTVRICWTTASATSNVCRWQIGIRAFVDDAEDLDTTSHDYATTMFANNNLEATAPSAAGEPVYDSIAITSGANMDSLAAGEMFILRIRRNTTTVGTDLTGDAYLISLSIRET